MTVTINLDLEQSLVAPTTPSGAPTYKVKATVASASGVSYKLFVYKTVDQSFSHPASVLDVETYPDELTTAQTGNALFYRTNTMEKTFATQTEAVAFRNLIQTRLLYLARDYPEAHKTFSGTTSFVITATAVTEQ
jgi:hypothetical protein